MFGDVRRSRHRRERPLGRRQSTEGAAWALTVVFVLHGGPNDRFVGGAKQRLGASHRRTVVSPRACTGGAFAEADARPVGGTHTAHHAYGVNTAQATSKPPQRPLPGRFRAYTQGTRIHRVAGTRGTPPATPAVVRLRSRSPLALCTPSTTDRGEALDVPIADPELRVPAQCRPSSTRIRRPSTPLGDRWGAGAGRQTAAPLRHHRS